MRKRLVPPSTALVDPPPSVPTLLPPPAAPSRTADRCPATTRHTSPYSAITYGVQCKFTKGHDGDHAGHGGFGDGDVFWPADPPPEGARP